MSQRVFKQHVDGCFQSLGGTEAQSKRYNDSLANFFLPLTQGLRPLCSNVLRLYSNYDST